MHTVTAIANGYFGGKVRVPGEVFGINAVEDFSVEWMNTDDPKVIAHVRKIAKSEGKFGLVMSDKARAIENAKTERGQRYTDWLEARDDIEDPAPETRRVNTGGTDGVVGADIPKAGQKLSAPERIAAAKALTGRDDITTAKEADALLAAATPLAGSDNDDRSRDLAIPQEANAPLPTETAAGNDI